MSDSSHGFNPFTIAQQQFDEAADHLDLSEGVRDLLRWPRREIHFTIPVRMHSGDIRVFRGYRVQYNSARGPAKGGIRWHPQETIDTVRALAAWMTWKTSLLDLPLGGGKGGIICDPRELTEFEKERLARGYIRQVGRLLGVTRDVPAPDVYTTPQIMAWMMDEYEAIVGEHHPGVITGKPLEVGGSQGRATATAHGGVLTVREAARRRDLDAANLTYAIQGFGNAGQNAALLHQKVLGGGTLIAACDSRSGVCSKQGLDPEKLMAWKNEKGTLEGFPGADSIGPGDLLELDVDVLYPAALENAITAENAGRIKAKIICELANGPTTPEADHILHEKGHFLIPDFLANAGGVTVSYFEQVQNTINLYWSEEKVAGRLEEYMVRAFDSAYEAATGENVHLRLGAYMVAVQRVADAAKLRGWV